MLPFALFSARGKLIDLLALGYMRLQSLICFSSSSESATEASPGIRGSGVDLSLATYTHEYHP